jgi:hypothetical protein
MACNSFYILLNSVSIFKGAVCIFTLEIDLWFSFSVFVWVLYQDNNLVQALGSLFSEEILWNWHLIFLICLIFFFSEALCV